MFVAAVVFTTYFAVPIFFIITGFYAYQADDSTIIRRLRKIFRITLFAILIYAVYTLQHMIRYDGLPVGITLSDIAQTAARFVILSDCRFISANHLWYLVSLIEGYIILLIIRRYNLLKAAYIYIPLSFIAQGMLCVFFLTAWYLRTNIFVAGLGWLLTRLLRCGKLSGSLKNQQKGVNCFSSCRVYQLYIFSFAFNVYFVPILIAVVELFSPLAVVPVFMLAVRKGAQYVKYPSFIMKIGVEYSLYIYIFHMLMDYMLSSLLHRLGIPSDTGIIPWMRPVIVLLMSIALSALIIKVRSKLFPHKDTGAS